MITNVSQCLPHILAGNSWHRYGMKKLRHCHPVYVVTTLWLTVAMARSVTPPCMNIHYVWLQHAALQRWWARHFWDNCQFSLYPETFLGHWLLISQKVNLAKSSRLKKKVKVKVKVTTALCIYLMTWLLSTGTACTLSVRPVSFLWRRSVVIEFCPPTMWRRADIHFACAFVARKTDWLTTVADCQQSNHASSKLDVEHGR